VTEVVSPAWFASRTLRPLVRAATTAPLLLVIDSLDGGGAERYVVDLALALRARDWPVEVACSAAGVRASALLDAGIPVQVLGQRLVKRRVCPAYSRALRRLVLARPPALVHAHLYASAAAAVSATAGLDVPVVVTEHTEGPWRTGPARRLSRRVYADSEAIVAVSSAITRLLVGQYDVPVERVHTLLPRPSRPAPPLPDRDSAAPKVGVVARLVPEKGVDVFLHAVARVVRAVPQARFVVVGDGPVGDRLRQLAVDLGLAGAVAFAGFRPDAPQVIAGLDLLVVPSRTDGSPLVVGEAMHAGVPVVASRVGGLPDLVEHGRTGLLVPPASVDDLARALVTLLLQPERLRALGACARRAALRQTHAGMVDRMEDLYRQVLRGRAVAGPTGRR